MTDSDQEPPRAGTPREVNWYRLARFNPKHEAGQDDEWTLPGARSPEEALAYFSKELGIIGRLELCDAGNPDAEFRLNKENRATSSAPASTTIRSAGVVVEQFLVKRV